MLPTKPMSVCLSVLFLMGLFSPLSVQAGLSEVASWAGGGQSVTGAERRQAVMEEKFKAALAFAEARDWDKAVVLLEELHKLRPASIAIANNLAAVYFQQGRINKAQQLLADILDSNPETRTSFQNLQRLYGFVTAEAYRQGLGEDKKGTMPDLILKRSLVGEIGARRSATAATPASSSEQTADRKIDLAEVISSGQPIVQEALSGWAAAWSEGNVDDYLAFYSPDYHPTGRSRASWEASRRKKITPSRKITVTISDQKFSRDPRTGWIIATFVQFYRARGYRDVITKQLVWEKQAGNWFIRQEKVIAPDRSTGRGWRN